MNRLVLRCRLKVSTVQQDLMLDGGKFRVGMTENAGERTRFAFSGQSARNVG